MLFSVMSPQWPRTVTQGWAGGRRPPADGYGQGWSPLPILPASCLPALCPAVHASTPAAQGAIIANRKAPQYLLSHYFRLRGVSSVSTNLFATLSLCRVCAPPRPSAPMHPSDHSKIDPYLQTLPKVCRGGGPASQPHTGNLQ